MELKRLAEMAKPAQTCPKCGMTGIAKTHYYYKGEFHCKKENLAAFAAKQAAGGIAPSTPPASPASNQPTTAPDTSTPVAPLAVSNAPKEKKPVNPITTKASKEPYHPSQFRIHLQHWLERHGIAGSVKINEDDTVTGISDIHIHGDNMKSGTCPVKFTVVAGDFSYSGGTITTLKNFPDTVDGELSATHNALTSLHGFPAKGVGGDVDFTDNAELKTIEGIADTLNGSLIMSGTGVTTLNGWHKILKKMDGYIDISNCDIQGGLLSPLMIHGCREIKMTKMLDGTSADRRTVIGEVLKIVNKHLQSEDKDIFACQDELIDAGYSDFAQM